MPKLIALYIRNVLAGFALSAVFVALLLMLDVAQLWHLVTHTRGGFLAVFLLWLFNGIVFAGVQFGVAVMRLGRTEEGDGAPPGGAAVSALAPVAASRLRRPGGTFGHRPGRQDTAPFSGAAQG